jgi:hypothetical protein
LLSKRKKRRVSIPLDFQGSFVLSFDDRIPTNPVLPVQTAESKLAGNNAACLILGAGQGYIAADRRDGRQRGDRLPTKPRDG